MKRLVFVCLALLSAAIAFAATPDEARLQQLTDDFDTAVATRDVAAIRRLLHAKYAYAEPEPTRPPTDPSLESRIVHRLSRDKCWSETAPSVLIVGPTAIVTGAYRVLEPHGKPRMLAQGRFTATWVLTTGTWQLLAEHRSLNDVLTWAAAEKPPTRPAPVVVAEAPAEPTADYSPASPTRKKTDQLNNAEVRVHRGLLPQTFSDLFRSYEPTQIGYTWDQADDPFMDFAFSAMLPLASTASGYPDPLRRSTGEGFIRHTAYTGPNLYFAATIRAGQYIGTRPSSPVVSKRFNPLLSLRFWGTDVNGHRESEDNFLEFVYGHESNGQFIASRSRFNEQLRVYLNQANDASTPEAATQARATAFLATRDNISRGWDYVGIQFARDWDAKLPWAQQRDVTMALRAKFNYYLPTGLAQGESEEYNAWEADPEGKARRRVDGLSFRYTLTVGPRQSHEKPSGLGDILQIERRYALTWTTGYVTPFRYNTLKAEAGVTLFKKLPFTVWYRYGYNSDLIDYYRKDHSLGLSLSYWNF